MGCSSLCHFKKRQEEQKQELQKQEEQKEELQKQEEQKEELQKQEEQKQEEQKQEEQKQEEQQEEQKQGSNESTNKKTILGIPKIINEPELGKFDDNFTWSAMVLAAQGEKANQISIDEIDWLTKLED